jgi:hypothetical protein
MKLPELPTTPENITPLEAVALLEPLISSYTLKSIRNEIFQKEHVEAKVKLEQIHDRYSWWNTRDGEPVLQLSKSFENRTEALAYIKEKELHIPEFKKTSYATSEGLPKTLCSLTCKGEVEGVDYEFEANYTRNGLPTKNCRVIPCVTYSVACDV